MSVNQETKIVRVYGEGFDHLDGADQAARIRTLLTENNIELEDGEKLLQGLGRLGYAYMGEGADGGQEIAMSWDLAQSRLDTAVSNRLATVEFRNYFPRGDPDFRVTGGKRSSAVCQLIGSLRGQQQSGFGVSRAMNGALLAF